jgi:hypothetical protein
MMVLVYWDGPIPFFRSNPLSHSHSNIPHDLASVVAYSNQFEQFPAIISLSRPFNDGENKTASFFFGGVDFDWVQFGAKGHCNGGLKSYLLIIYKKLLVNMIIQ